MSTKPGAIQSSEGKAGVDKILQVFVERGFVETEAMETDHTEIAELAPTQKKSIKVEDENFEVLLVKAKQVADERSEAAPGCAATVKPEPTICLKPRRLKRAATNPCSR